MRLHRSGGPRQSIWIGDRPPRLRALAIQVTRDDRRAPRRRAQPDLTTAATASSAVGCMLSLSLYAAVYQHARQLWPTRSAPPAA